MGDLGNIKADSKGVGFMCVKPSKVKLFGKVGGGAQLGDDLGRGCNEESLKTGIRARVARGVIVLAKKLRALLLIVPYIFRLCSQSLGRRCWRWRGRAVAALSEPLCRSWVITGSRSISGCILIPGLVLLLLLVLGLLVLLLVVWVLGVVLLVVLGG